MKNLALMALLLLSTAGVCQKNLIRNGGFDTDTENWRGDALTNNLYDKKSGSASGMINQYTGTDWKGVDQIFDIPKGAFAIAFSAWIKSDGIEGGKDRWNAGIMTAAFTTGNDSELASENIAELHGSQGWKEYKKIVMVPGGASRVRLMLALAQTPGTIYYDDVKAMVVTEDDYLKVMQDEAQVKRAEAVARANQPKEFQNGDFEDGLKNWDGNGKVSNVGAKEGSAYAAVTSATPDWAAIEQTADIPEGTKSIEISGFLKSQDIVQGKDSWNHGMLIIAFTKADQASAGTDTNLVDAVGTTDWAAFSKMLEVPAGAKKYKVMLALNHAAGTLMADGIKVNLIK